MIGGYLHSEIDPDLDARLRAGLDDSHTLLEAWDHGFLFHGQPFQDQPASRFISDDTIAVSEDLLVRAGDEYQLFSPTSEFADRLAGDPAGAFDSIASDYRMVAVQRRDGAVRLLLASQRAASG